MIAALAIVALSGCDRSKEAELEQERRRHAAEQAALAKENEMLLAEKEIAEKHAKAEAELRKAEAGRAALALERARLAEEKAKLAADKATNEASRAAAAKAQEEMERKLAGQQMELELAEKRAAEEKTRMEEAQRRALAKKAEMEKATAEARAREEAAARAQAEAERRTTAIFFDALAEHGIWLDSDRFGFVWKPLLAGKDWRPYVDGRWLWTEFGWAWHSNEPFGWAVYHYGRWAKIPGTGWVWVPGSEWASAWVAWRFTREAAGWAPLPPEAHSGSGFNGAVDDYYDIGPAAYVFIKLTDFDAGSYKDRLLPRAEALQVLENSSNLTAIQYARVGNRLVLTSGGPSVSHINNVLLREREGLDEPPLRRMAVQLLDGPADAAGAEMVSGNALLLRAPQLEHKPASGRPRGVGQRLEIKSIERGWTQENEVRDAIWRDRLKVVSRAIEGSERAAAARAAAAKSAPPSPVAKPLPPPPVPAQRPVARPVERPTPTPNPRGLQPSRLQPSGGLNSKRP